jgi:hypothetical protein
MYTVVLPPGVYPIAVKFSIYHIRRNNRINTTPGICHSLWMTIWYAGWDEIPFHPTLHTKWFYLQDLYKNARLTKHNVAAVYLAGPNQKVPPHSQFLKSSVQVCIFKLKTMDEAQISSGSKQFYVILKLQL